MTSASTETLLWFLNTLVIIRVSHANGPDEIALMEHVESFGDSPPLHEPRFRLRQVRDRHRRSAAQHLSATVTAASCQMDPLGQFPAQHFAPRISRQFLHKEDASGGARAQAFLAGGQ